MVFKLQLLETFKIKPIFLRTKYSVFILMILIIQGCGLSKYAFWDGLTPYNPEISESIELAKIYFSDKGNRAEAIKTAAQYANSFYISRINQIRLSLFVEVLSFCADDAERKLIRDILVTGRKHRDFIGNFIVGGCSIAPPFILFTIDVLSQDENYFAYLPNPDSGLIEKIYIKKYVVYDLEQGTGEKFGDNFQKWRKWWIRENKNLNYDWKRMKYIKLLKGKDTISGKQNVSNFNDNKDKKNVSNVNKRLDTIRRLGYLDDN